MAASKPTFPLSWTTNALHPFTLNRHLGTLTSGWVVPLLDTKLTPDALTPGVYDECTFGVWQGTEKFLPLNTQLVLYRAIDLDRDLP